MRVHSPSVRWLWLAIVATLAACTTPPFQPSVGTMTHDQSRWVPVAWSDLPGWNDDELQQAWPVLLRSCQKPAPDWASLCARAQQSAPRDDAQTRAWLMQNLRPYRVETLQGVTQGLITGYYEPLFEARRQPGGAFHVPL